MKILVVAICLISSSLGEEVRLLDLEPNDAQNIIESKDASLKYAPKIDSNVPAVRFLGNEPHNVLEDIYLANQYHGQDGVGGYLYGYSVPDIAKTEKKKAGGDLRGAYNYVAGNGQEIKVEYWDNGSGFHQIDNVPKILPKQIDDTPKVKAAKEEHARIWQEQAERNSHPIASPYAQAPQQKAHVQHLVNQYQQQKQQFPNPGQNVFYQGGQGGQYQGQPSQNVNQYKQPQSSGQQNGQYLGQGGQFAGKAQGGGQYSAGQFGSQSSGQFAGNPQAAGQYSSQPSGQFTEKAQGGGQYSTGQSAGNAQAAGQFPGLPSGQPTGNTQGGGQFGSQSSDQFAGNPQATGQYSGQPSGQFAGKTQGGGQFGGQSSGQFAGNPQTGGQYSGGQFVGKAPQSGQYSGAQSQSSSGQFSASLAGKTQGGGYSSSGQFGGQYAGSQQSSQYASSNDEQGDWKYNPAEDEQGDKGDWKYNPSQEEQGPPKGFFYNFDYPVGIIVQKDGGAGGLKDIYNSNKANFEKQLQTGGDRSARSSTGYLVV